MLAIATMPMLPMPTLPIQNAGNFDVATPNLSVLLTSMPIIKANANTAKATNVNTNVGNDNDENER